MELYDTTIIGGGAGGLYTTFYAGMRDMKVKLVEAQPEFGGKITAFMEKMIWDVGGQPPITAKDFLQNLVEQAQLFSPTICLNTNIDKIYKEEDYFKLVTTTGEEHFSKTIIIAIGAGVVHPLLLEAKNVEKYEGKQIHYKVDDFQKFYNKEVVVTGGGNAAVDWAVELYPIAKKVTLVYRGDELKAFEGLVKLIEEYGIDTYLNAEITKLKPDEAKLNLGAVRVKQFEEKHRIKADELLVCYGYDRKVSLQFDEEISPKRENNLIVALNQSTTSVPGMFVVGDVSHFANRTGLFAGAFSEGILAVNSAMLFIEPTARERPIVSTNNEKFREANELLMEERLEKMKNHN